MLEDTKQIKKQMINYTGLYDAILLSSIFVKYTCEI
jgi:hypothetical protein